MPVVGSSCPAYAAFALVLGIAAPWTVGRRNKHRILLSFGTGLLVVAGIYAYWFPLASQADATMNAYCAEIGVHCHVGPIDVSLLNLFLFSGSVVVLLGAGITSLLLKRNRKSQGGSHPPPFPHPNEP